MSNRASPVAALPAIRGRLLALAARFQHDLPSKPEILGFFDPDGFYHNGLVLDRYLDDVLLKPRALPEPFDFVGFTISEVKIDEVVDADHVFVTYTVSVTHPSLGPSTVSYRPWQERMLMTRACGEWRLSGNQKIALANVAFHARLAQKPLTQAELNARPDVFTVLATWDPLQRTAYLMRIPDPPNPDVIGWIGFPGDEGFGSMAWASDSRFDRYLGSPDSRVRVYLEFDVSSAQVDPGVAYVHVTGPGLPTVGLDLVQSEAAFPRPHLIFRGDQFHWNCFDTERCSTMGFIPNCALDWSQVQSGASYVYSFRDKNGRVLDQMTLQLRGELLGEAAWYAARDQYFGQFTLDPAFQFTIANVLDASTGSPFIGGGTVELKWRLPTGDGMRLEGVSYWRQYTDYSGTYQEEHWYPLYGMRATSVMARSDPEFVAFPTTWAWSTLIFRDAFGNWFDQELSPLDPY
jgi:hypothetical protein